MRPIFAWFAYACFTILWLEFWWNLKLNLPWTQVKECDKSQIMREKKVKYIHLEKKILAEILVNSPYFVKLAFTFQDEDSLCKTRKLFLDCYLVAAFKLVFFLLYRFWSHLLFKWRFFIAHNKVWQIFIGQDGLLRRRNYISPRVHAQQECYPQVRIQANWTRYVELVKVIGWLNQWPITNG